MTIATGLALLLSAIVGGGLNSVAGGGSFITFPTLIFTGVPAIPANATNTVALWPGTLVSILPYRDTLQSQRQALLSLLGVGLAGGLIGSIILLRTPPQIFKYILPYLLLSATLIFTFGGTITAVIRKRFGQHEAKGQPRSRGAAFGMSTLQFVIAMYGGFFGGGLGILLLALFSLMEMKNIHAMNALKVTLTSAINGIAVVAFIIAGEVFWPQALLMVVGAIIGGYFGATLARKVEQRYVRWFVMIVGFSISAYFFATTYLFTQH